MKVIDYTDAIEEEALNIPLSYIRENFINNDMIFVFGVESGGVKISEKIVEKITNYEFSNVFHATVRCQRPSTKKIKKRNFLFENFLKNIFKITPKFFLNLLRKLEHYFFLVSKKTSRREVFCDWSQVEDRLKKTKLILIVDDAVDSGESLKSVNNYMLEKLIDLGLADTVSIKNFSITITQKDPCMMPDFYWAKNVLIRFPWSLDAK